MIGVTWLTTSTVCPACSERIRRRARATRAADVGDRLPTGRGHADVGHEPAGRQRVLLLRPRRRSGPRGRRSPVRRGPCRTHRQAEGGRHDLGGLPRPAQRRGDDHSMPRSAARAAAASASARPVSDSGRSLRPLNRRSGVCSVCPCRSRCVTVVTTGAGSARRLEVVLEDDGLGGRVAVHRLAVHGAVGQRVGGAVLRARHPRVADRAQLPGDAAAPAARAASCRGA